jgi:DNA repair exonuclease SbcCD ATPase subunit
MQRHGTKEGDERLTELEERLRQEEYLKQGYEKTVRELRERVKVLESEGGSREAYRQEIDELRRDLTKEREWRARFNDIERELNQRLAEQESRIAGLEIQLREKDLALTDAAAKTSEYDQLARENQTLASALRDQQVRYEAVTDECRTLSDRNADQYLSTLHKELSLQRRASESEVEPGRQIAEMERKMKELEGKYAVQMEYSRDLQPPSLLPNSNRIEELEAKLRTSSAKYEEMKRQITAPSSFHRSKDAPFTKDSPKPPRPKATEEVQSFRSYSIKEESEVAGKKKVKRTRSVDKRTPTGQKRK